MAGALQYFAGIDIRQRGANGVQADAGIRGSTFDQVLVLINGIKISDLQTGHHSLNLPIDIENIERIEVLKGPGARIFGQNAFAGAINIITKNPDQPFFKIQLAAGQHGLFGGRMAGSFSTGKMNHYLSVAHDGSEGYKYNTDYSIRNYFYQNTFTWHKNEFQLMGGWTDRKFGANGFYASPDFMDQYEEVQTSLSSLSWKRSLGSNIFMKSDLYWRRNHDNYVFVRSDPGIYQNIHTSNNFGGEVNLSINSKLGTTGLGLDLNQLHLESTNLGNRERSVATLFAEQRIVLLNGKLGITPGLQLNYYSDFGTNFLPGVDMGYDLDNHISLFANWGRTYRVPTFTDLYYTDPANAGNPNLLPEFANTYEFGVKTNNWKGITGQVSYFQRNGQDIIDWTKQDPEDKWTPGNLIGVNTSGVDGNFSFRNPTKSKWLSEINIGFTFINASTVDVGEQFSRYALEHLKHQYSAGVTLRYGSHVQHTIYYRYYDRLNLSDYHLIDSRLNVKWKSISLFVEATNLLDTIYKETNLVTMPGRWLRSGLGYIFQ